MKIIIILSILFAPALTLAQDLKIPAPGKYQFHGQYSVVLKKRYEAVYTGSSEGKERVEKLRSEGSTCEAKPNSFYLCSQFLNPNGSEKEIADRARKVFEKKYFQFFEIQGEPKLVTKGDSMEFWEIPQMVTTDQNKYETYQYMKSENIEKIFLGSPAQDTLNIDLDGLNYPLSLQKTESKWVYYSYLILGRYTL
ncbi:MAG: hypothetical protein M9962_00610 [Oligoflexia bacterium]|nr:hypothetical protein [Oligoflexia bacterium]